MRNVFIITRCISMACKESSWLVLDSIKTGFPTNRISVIYLGDFAHIKILIRNKCNELGIIFDESMDGILDTNDQVIKMLVENETEDFVVVDSDCVFWSDLSWYNPIQLLAGRHIPEHTETAGNVVVTEERLHTSLLYFTRLSEIRQTLKDCFKEFLDGRFAPFNPFAPVVTMNKGVAHFYDSCSSLYGVLGGEAFGKDVLDCYDHLHAGSFYDKLVEAKPSLDIKLWQGAFSHPESLKGIHKKQRIYWYKSAFQSLQYDYCANISEDAMTFLLGYGNYVSLIDDLIDEPSDPKRVSKMTAMATKLFTSNFWQQWGRELLVIEQLVHVIYFSSLEWEKSPEAWKRRDARVLSHCGYYLIIAVYLLETRDVEKTQKFAKEMLEKNHLEHMEDLTMEEQSA